MYSLQSLSDLSAWLIMQVTHSLPVVIHQPKFEILNSIRFQCHIYALNPPLYDDKYHEQGPRCCLAKTDEGQTGSQSIRGTKHH